LAHPSGYDSTPARSGPTGGPFELVGGDCIWEPARAKDLTIATWTKIDPCVFRFENLWPARLGC